MNSNKKTIFAFLVLGLIFSSIIRIKFNFHNGFEFQNFWITIPLPLFSMGSDLVKNLALTSTIVGYLFYAGFGIALITNINSSIKKHISFLIFLLLLVISFSIELILLIQGVLSYAYDYHARIGPTLFLIGLYIYFKRFRFKKSN